MEVGKTVYRYVVRDADGVTVRQFRTNDAEFAERVIKGDMKRRGWVGVTRTVSESFMHVGRS